MDKIFDPAKFQIQTFDDSEERRNNGTSKKELAQIFLYDQEKIGKLQKVGAGIYFCINPQIDPFARGVENTKEFARLGLDLDVTKEKYGTSKGEIKEKKNKLLQEISALKHLPDIVIESKNGFQPVWIWDKPIPLKTLEDRNKANEYYKQIVKGFGHATGLISEGDNIARVLRLPGTFHLKNPNDPFRISIVEIIPKP